MTSKYSLDDRMHRALGLANGDKPLRFDLKTSDFKTLGSKVFAGVPVHHAPGMTMSDLVLQPAFPGRINIPL
jgi:hypothetical protein